MGADRLFACLSFVGCDVLPITFDFCGSCAAGSDV